jgi:ring-1,2-phenylacetyl-CoA epoxidase subunit PaaE
MPLLPRHRAQAEAFRAQAAGRGEVHPLLVSERTQLTPDSVMLTFEVPEPLRETYRHQSGQHLILFADVDGEELRRSYSICTAAGSDRLAVAIRRVDGGRFSSWAVDNLGAGDTVRVMAPAGHFTPQLDPQRKKRYATVALGSGITPILSIVSTILEVEPGSEVTLVYGNRDPISAMFLSEIERLSELFHGRLTVHHRYSRSAGTPETPIGRLDPAGVIALAGGDCTAFDDWYLCGPPALVEALARSLAEAGVDEDRVHQELFSGGAINVAALDELPELEADVTLIVGGVESRHRVASRETILAAALGSRPDIPFACRDGVCGTCRARPIAGRVVMERTSALSRRDRAGGYVLACVAHPATETVTLSFDA